MTTTTFPALTKGISWTPSTTGAAGAVLPTGEAISSTTLGIRTDGDTTHALGNYQWLVVIPAPASTETLAALNAALTSALPPGNYWLNGEQTDTLNGQTATSAWGATESPFSIPVPIVQPAPPTNFLVA